MISLYGGRSYGSAPGGAQAQGGKVGVLRNQVDEVSVGREAVAVLCTTLIKKYIFKNNSNWF